MISILDYGVGNLRSLDNAFHFLGIPSKLIHTPEEILGAEKLVLPGVGAFGYALQNMHRLNLVEPLLEEAGLKTPILGVCLGMQLFFTESEEGGRTRGLNLIPGQVKRFTVSLKVPHMGWNEIEVRRENTLLRELPAARHAYFVHSYYCQPEDPETVTATTEYGRTFASAVQHENLWGVQFHPEKSQELGLKILQNFAEA